MSHGDVYVTEPENSRVQKFGSNGEFILMFGAQVNATEDVKSGATEAQKNLCTAASGDTCKVGVAGPAPGQFEGLGGRSIAVDATGTIYVGDENRVQTFSEGGELTGKIALPGAGLTENLTVDSTGEIYVQSRHFPGVRKYDSSGTELPPPRDEAGELATSALTIGPANELFVNDLEEGRLEAERHRILSFDAAGKQLASFDRAAQAEDGRFGIAYSEVTKALYVLNEGAVRIATLPPPGPFVLAGSENVSEIQPASATLGATINPEGEATTECHFEYGTTTAYGESTAATVLTGTPFEDQPASAAITRLQPRTTYHFRVVATNGTQTAYGPDETFTTLPPVGVDGESVTQVTSESALLEAELNPHGQATEYHFEYDTTPYGEGEAEHGTRVPVSDGSAGSGTIDVTRSAVIQGLTASKAYYYRVVAENELGKVEGEEKSFTTQGAAALVLPDARAWELVSPPNKHGSPLEPITEEGGEIQAAADGGGLAYVAKAPIDSEPAGARSSDLTTQQLLAERGASGWATQEIATPHEEISIARGGFPSEYKFFAEDLSSGIVEPEGATLLSPQTTERTPYRREADGEYVPLVTSNNVLPGAKFGGEESIGNSSKAVSGRMALTLSPRCRTSATSCSSRRRCSRQASSRGLCLQENRICMRSPAVDCS